MNALILCILALFKKKFPKSYQIKACVPTINMTYGGSDIWLWCSRLNLWAGPQLRLPQSSADRIVKEKKTRKGYENTRCNFFFYVLA